MFGWRARIGVLLPPGNPTVEPELYRMAPDGVSVHFARLEAPPSDGPPGGAAGMEERTRAYREGLAGPTAALGQVRPAVIVLAHTASSYALGFGNEQPLIDRIASLGGAPALLAAHAALAALQHFGVKRLALGTPYPESISRQGKAYWEAAGFQIVGYHRLADVADIYAESEKRASPRPAGRRARRRGCLAERNRPAHGRGHRDPRARPGQAGHQQQPGLSVAGPPARRGPRGRSGLRPPAPRALTTCYTDKVFAEDTGRS